MAKKDGRKKDKKSSGAADTVEAVRSAVERALPEGSRDRGRELVDEVARAVTRVRESLEQHGVFDELGRLRNEVESLARRVANLERPGAASKTATTRPAAVKTKSSATKRARSKAAKSSATKRSATKASTTKSAASKAASTKRRATKSATSKRARSKASSTRSTGS